MEGLIALCVWRHRLFSNYAVKLATERHIINIMMWYSILPTTAGMT
jgi:hypothetical protein